jgi:hypothetical protein
MCLVKMCVSVTPKLGILSSPGLNDRRTIRKFATQTLQNQQRQVGNFVIWVEFWSFCIDSWNLSSRTTIVPTNVFGWAWKRCHGFHYHWILVMVSVDVTNFDAGHWWREVLGVYMYFFTDDMIFNNGKWWLCETRWVLLLLYKQLKLKINNAYCINACLWLGEKVLWKASSLDISHGAPVSGGHIFGFDLHFVYFQQWLVSNDNWCLGSYLGHLERKSSASIGISKLVLAFQYELEQGEIYCNWEVNTW